MSNLAEELPKEINRVRELQDQYKSLRGMGNVIVEPQIMMMEAEIQAAIDASTKGNVLGMMRSCAALKGYTG